MPTAGPRFRTQSSIGSSGAKANLLVTGDEHHRHTDRPERVEPGARRRAGEREPIAIRDRGLLPRSSPDRLGVRDSWSYRLDGRLPRAFSRVAGGPGTGAREPTSSCWLSRPRQPGIPIRKLRCEDRNVSRRDRTRWGAQERSRLSRWRLHDARGIRPRQLKLLRCRCGRRRPRGH